MCRLQSLSSLNLRLPSVGYHHPCCQDGTVLACALMLTMRAQQAIHRHTHRQQYSSLAVAEQQPLPLATALSSGEPSSKSLAFPSQRVLTMRETLREWGGGWTTQRPISGQLDKSEDRHGPRIQQSICIALLSRIGRPTEVPLYEDTYHQVSPLYNSEQNYSCLNKILGELVSDC